MAEPRKRSLALLGGYLLAAITLMAAISESVSLVPRLYSLYQDVKPWVRSLTDGEASRQVKAPPAEPPSALGLKRVEPLVESEDPPSPPAPLIQRVAVPSLPALARYEILIDFPSYAIASQRGVEIARVDRQSRLKGWLCPQDRIVSIDGVPLTGSDPGELREDLIRRLQASPDFLIRFRPQLDQKHVTWDEAGEVGLLDGHTVHQSAGPRRDC